MPSCVAIEGGPRGRSVRSARNKLLVNDYRTRLPPPNPIGVRVFHRQQDFLELLPGGEWEGAATKTITCFSTLAGILRPRFEATGRARVKRS